MSVSLSVDGGYRARWWARLVGLDLRDRDQRQADVAHLLEQAVQRGLVDDRAVDDGGAVALVGEAQPVEPGGPAGVEVPLEADLVPSGLVAVGVDVVRSSAPFRRRCVRCWRDQKVGADVVSGHHHMW